MELSLISGYIGGIFTILRQNQITSVFSMLDLHIFTIHHRIIEWYLFYFRQLYAGRQLYFIGLLKFK